MRDVDFYFDFACPWSYLALVRLQDVCERNHAQILFKPVSVAQILSTENPSLLDNRFAANPAKAAWQSKDLHQWADFWGLKIELGDGWPQNRDTAAAGALHAIAADAGVPFCLALFRAAYGAGEDINQAAVLERVAHATGVDADAVIAAASDPQRHAAIRTNSLELIERGGFGTPSMFLEDSMYFGNDRLGLIEWTLGPVADEDFIMPGQHDSYTT